MNKRELIFKITKLDASLAWNFKGDFWGNKEWESNNDYDMPYRKYVINNSIYLGIDGGPSPVDLWEYNYIWNLERLKKETHINLKKLYKDIKSKDKFYTNLFMNYGKKINILDFFNIKQ